MAATTPTDLSGLFQFLSSSNGLAQSQISTPQAQAMLAQLRQYDPNASFVSQQMGSDTGGTPGYDLSFDASKLPGETGTGSLGGTSGAGTGNFYQPSFSPISDPSRVIDPSQIVNSPNYGRVTANTNFKPDPMTGLDIWGPLIVGALGLGFGSGLLGFGTGDAAAGAGAGAGGAADAGASGAFDMGGWTGTGIPGLDPGAAAAATGATGAAGAAGDTGATASTGYGANAADEVGALPGYGAGALPADAGSIATSNWLVAHGLPAALGGSAGAVGGALSSLGGLGGIARTAGSLLGKFPGLPGGTGGTGSGTPLLLGGGGGGGSAVAPDSLAMLRAFYAPKTAAHMGQLPVATSPMAAMLQQPGGIQNLLGQLMQGGGYG